jgi:hypothetical protein
MKKYIIASLALSLLFSVNANGQAFQKGSINLDLGIGLGMYGTKQTVETELTANAFGTPFSQSNVNDTTDGAASTIIPFSFEYGISDKIGLGVDLTSSNYFIDEEDKKYLNSVKGFDFGVRVNYHLLNSEKNDLFIGLGLGASTIKWTYGSSLTNNPFGLTDAKGSGSYFSLGLTDRIFFSEHVGILFSLEYRGYSYSGIVAEGEGSDAFAAFGVTDVKFKQTLDWKLNGVHFGTGIAVKF